MPSLSLLIALLYKSVNHYYIMVKKIVVELNDLLYHCEEDDYLAYNKKLYDVVTFYKNKITQYYENKSWDKYKKLTNEYELIFTSPNATHNVSKYAPVSRSFFKLWEILHDSKVELFSCDNMKCMFLAEGPGGFAEAMMKFRGDYHSGHEDEYYGITLKSNNNKMIPDWKYRNSKLQISYGKDGTGNLYNVDNIDDVCGHLGTHSMDFITADGGFDFSSDFNGQEEMSLRLITCEIYSALRLQKEGGAFIVKVFDIFTPYSIKLLGLVSSCYKSAKLIKPLTSRPANSEKYLLCNGYTPKQEVIDALRRLCLCKWNEGAPTQSHMNVINAIETSNIISRNLVVFNMLYVSRQVSYIQKTIDYIKQFNNVPENGIIKKILDSHIDKVKKWCMKYDIPTA